MKRKEIFLRIREIIANINPLWNEAVVCEASDIRNEIGMESIDYLDLILQVEIMFDIKIEPEEASKVRLISDFIDIVESKFKE